MRIFLVLFVICLISPIDTGYTIEANNDDIIQYVEKLRKQSDLVFNEIGKNGKLVKDLRVVGALLGCGAKEKSNTLMGDLLEEYSAELVTAVIGTAAVDGNFETKDTQTVLLMTEVGLRRFTGGYAVAFIQLLDSFGQREAVCNEVIKQ